MSLKGECTVIEMTINIGVRIHDEAAFLAAARTRALSMRRGLFVANLRDAALVLFADERAPAGSEILLSSAEDVPLDSAPAPMLRGPGG